VTTLSPQSLADLWYLKFGNAWVTRDDLNTEWKKIGRELMRNNLADYDLVHTQNSSIPTIEIIKLKETCR